MRYTLGHRINYLAAMEHHGVIEKAEGGICFPSIDAAWLFLTTYQGGIHVEHWTFFGLRCDFDGQYIEEPAEIFLLDEVDYSQPIALQIDQLLMERH